MAVERGARKRKRLFGNNSPWLARLDGVALSTSPSSWDTGTRLPFSSPGRSATSLTNPELAYLAAKKAVKRQRSILRSKRHGIPVTEKAFHLSEVLDMLL